jgi:hypothetical protein
LRRVSAVQPAILVTLTGGGRPEHGRFAAWPDGTLVWAENRLLGGSPYKVGHVAPEAVEQVVRGVAVGGKFYDQRRFAPDARHTNLRMNLGVERIVDVASGHEIAEHDPGLVATATGIEPLDGRSRAAVLAVQPAEYQAFRDRWNAVNDAVWGLCPAAGEPATRATLARLSWGSGTT